jgi:hypothetical protein
MPLFKKTLIILIEIMFSFPCSFFYGMMTTLDFIHLYGLPLLTVKIRQPSHEFTFGVGISFIPYPLVLTPVV